MLIKYRGGLYRKTLNKRISGPHNYNEPIERHIKRFVRVAFDINHKAVLNGSDVEVIL